MPTPTKLTMRDFFLVASAWVIGVHAALLVLLSLQVVVSMWELRRQKTGWPSLQLHQLFTQGALLLLARTTLVVYLTINFYKSWMLFGVPDYKTNLGYWSSSVVRYPEAYVLPCATACAYGASVVIQDIFSHLMGPLNNPLRACTAMICALLYIGLAVVSSPLFVKVVIGSYYVTPTLMILAILTSILTFLQAILCLTVPDILRETPEAFSVLARNISGEMSERRPKQTLSTLATVEDAASGTSTKKLLGKNLSEHFFLLVPASVAVLLTASGEWNSIRNSWGSVVMLCGDAVVLGQILPALVVEMLTSAHHKASLCLQACYLIVECTLLFIGTAATLCVDRSVLPTAAAVVNFSLGCYLLNKMSEFKMKPPITKSTSTTATISTSTTTDTTTSKATTKGKRYFRGRDDEEPLTEAGPADAHQHDQDGHAPVVS
ncbi:uncharacterized protein [Procambarus clarkii]|uniref:uncharacterized protein isoform X1 n=1 Tax=Procambarus clarkii TaxID=6728 RepID=UPI00374317F0